MAGRGSVSFFDTFLAFRPLSLKPSPTLGLAEEELWNTSSPVNHTSPSEGGQVSTTAPAVAMDEGILGMKSKLLISKREKLKLGGGGEDKRGTQRFVVAGLDRGHHPTPYFAFTMFPREAADAGSVYT